MCGPDICIQNDSTEVLRKNKKLYAAFMDLEKANDRVDREALWNVLKIYVWEDSYWKELRHFIKR